MSLLDRASESLRGSHIRSSVLAGQAVRVDN
jgi:hypothetical protein